MSIPSTQEVTEMLVAWSNGDKSALERLIPLVHDELHRLAHRYMNRERPVHMLQTTALVNEAYLRLVDSSHVRWQNRGEAPLSALYPLAHLGLARASALAGNVAGSRKAYQDFLALSKDADADLPVLIEAKKEL